MTMGLVLEQGQRQQTILGAEARQGIELLSMSISEVRRFLEESVEENPFLCSDGDAAEKLGDCSDASCFAKALRDRAAQQGESDGRRVECDVRFSFGRSREATDGAEDGRTLLFERASYGRTIVDALEEVAGLAAANDDERRIGLFLAGCVDDSGYLRISCEDAACELGVDASVVQRVLFRLQRGTVAGVAARNVAECILLQLEARRLASPLMRRMISCHLEELAEGRLRAVAVALGVSLDVVQGAFDLVRTLNPRPGLALGCDRSQPVEPEVEMRRGPEGVEVRLRCRVDGTVMVNERYVSWFECQAGKEARAEAASQIKRARSLVDNLQRREEAVLKVASCIAEVQGGYLFDSEALKPLTMTEVARLVGCTVSSVSRIAGSVYAQTPRGTMQLRRFFSCGGVGQRLFPNGDGEAAALDMVSSDEIKRRIKLLVDSENSSDPLSDQAIGVLLEAQGLRISRRTVNKYRNELGIPSRERRRRYGLSA